MQNMKEQQKGDLMLIDAKKDWEAKWIWDAFHQHTANCYAYFRKVATLEEVDDINEVRIYCTCSSEYKLYINGCYIGRGSIPSQVEYQYYDEYYFSRDEAGELFNSENIVTAVCYNYGVGLHYRPVARAGFLLQMEIKHTDGSIDYIVTDNTWKMIIPGWLKQDSPQMFWTLGFQEIVDLTKYDPDIISGKLNLNPSINPDNNTDPSAYNGDSWDFAVEIGISPVDPWLNLIPRDIPQLTETSVAPHKIMDYGECEINSNGYSLFNVADIINMENHTPIKTCDISFLDYQEDKKCMDSFFINNINEKCTIFIVFDFMKEVVGYPFFEFEAEGNGTINIGYSECLDSNGRVDPTRQGIKQADTLMFKQGQFKWEMFNRRAFRYMQVTIRGVDKPFTLKKVYINSVSYPFEKSGYFRCSNEVINRIYEISKYTLDVCMKENYEDCPLREHAQYMGDMRVEALMNYYTFGDTKLIAKGLRQFAREQREDGWFKTLCPGSTIHNIVDYLPLWVIALREYYLFTGDIGLLNELYPNMQKLMNWFKSQSNENGLLEKKPDWWIFIDWADMKKDGIVTGLQCFYYKALIDASWIAKTCGDEINRKSYQIEALKVKASINKLLWDEKERAYVDCLMDSGVPENNFSIQTNYLAVILNISNEEKRRSIRDFLISGKCKKVITGYFKNYELEALFSLKCKKKFLKEFMYWAEMLKRGASTWWEVFDIDMEDNVIQENSLCHGWSSAPLFHLPSKILGVMPLKPGFQEVLIKPDLLGLEWVEGSIPTVRGDIIVKLCSGEKSINFTCELPEKVTAYILLPFDISKDVTEIRLNYLKQEIRVIGGRYLFYKLEKRGKYSFEIYFGTKECKVI